MTLPDFLYSIKKRVEAATEYNPMDVGTHLQFYAESRTDLPRLLRLVAAQQKVIEATKDELKRGGQQYEMLTAMAEYEAEVKSICGEG